MERKKLLITVVLMVVTLMTAIVSTRVFVALAPYEAPTEEADTELPTAAMGTTLTPEAAEASRLQQQFLYEQASKAAAAAQAQMQLTMNQSQDEIAAQYKDKEALSAYVSQALADGTIDYETLFDGTLLVGDYPAATINMYNLLGVGQCIGRTDADLDFLNEKIVEIVAKVPETLILHFGMYELQEDVTLMQTTFIERYKTLILQIKQLLPATKIVVSSIFPVTTDAQKTDPKYDNRIVYNAALQAMCADNGWQFLYNENIVAQHPDLFSAGGVFLSGDFYKDYWLQYIYVQSRNIASGVTPAEPTATEAEDALG